MYYRGVLSLSLVDVSPLTSDGTITVIKSTRPTGESFGAGQSNRFFANIGKPVAAIALYYCC